MKKEGRGGFGVQPDFASSYYVLAVMQSTVYNDADRLERKDVQK